MLQVKKSSQGPIKTLTYSSTSSENTNPINISWNKTQQTMEDQLASEKHYYWGSK